MRAENIDGVITLLDTILPARIAERSVAGYFAALYRQVTLAVRDDIRAGRFDDGPRMDRLDTVFANRYFDALDAHTAGAAASSPWKLTFEFADRGRGLIVQHLLLAMNAHINYDLAQAVAEVTDVDDIGALERDFLHLNTILAGLLEAAQSAISTYSPAFWLMDVVGGPKDETTFGFALRKARAHAWIHAVELVSGRNATTVGHLERVALELGHRIARPHCKLRLAARLARQFESTDTAAITHRLNSLAAGA